MKPEVVVNLKKRRQYSHRVKKHKGTAENPLSDEEFFFKFKDCASLVLRPERVEEVLYLLLHLDEFKDILRLMKLKHKEVRNGQEFFNRFWDTH